MGAAASGGRRRTAPEVALVATGELDAQAVAPLGVRRPPPPPRRLPVPPSCPSTSNSSSRLGLLMVFSSPVSGFRGLNFS